MDVVLRALRGEDLESLADELGITASLIGTWRDEFLAAGVSRLDNHRDRGPRKEQIQEVEAAVYSPPSDWRHVAASRTRLGLIPPSEAPGLRERKKAKTRSTIRSHAMRLFAEQGYDATTVNQIAEAAEVSPSTFFRYFATKEDVVFDDESDEELIRHFHAQSPDWSPVQAAYGALIAGMASTSSEEAVREQTLLCLSVPELRSALFDNMTQLMLRIGELIAERQGRDPRDLEVKTFAAAIQGVWMSTLFDWAEDPKNDLRSSMDKAMTLLEQGVPL